MLKIRKFDQHLQNLKYTQYKKHKLQNHIMVAGCPGLPQFPQPVWARVRQSKATQLEDSDGPALVYIGGDLCLQSRVWGCKALQK